MKIFIGVQFVVNVIVSSLIPHLLRLIRKQPICGYYFSLNGGFRF